MRKQPPKSDNYETPRYLADWAVKYALDQLGIEKRSSDDPWLFLEPGCGEEAPFSHAAIEQGCNTVAIDNRTFSEEEPVASEKFGAVGVNSVFYHGTDFLDAKQMEDFKGVKFDIIATNPPFSKALPFVWKSLEYLDKFGIMIFLLKLPFLSSIKRSKLFAERPPKEVIVIQRRPSFGIGPSGATTDMTEYGFYLWVGDLLDKNFKKYGGRDTIIKWLNNKELMNKLEEEKNND